MYIMLNSKRGRKEPTDSGIEMWRFAAFSFACEFRSSRLTLLQQISQTVRIKQAHLLLLYFDMTTVMKP